jgi:hypothetical protein
VEWSAVINNIPPCFFCEYPAEYMGEVVEVEGFMKVVEVCKKHYTGVSEASS